MSHQNGSVLLIICMMEIGIFGALAMSAFINDHSGQCLFYIGLMLLHGILGCLVVKAMPGRGPKR